MNARLPLAIAILATASSCANVDRSRNLSNSAVPAETIALQVCAVCHGRDGNAVSPNFPSLAGQSKAYLAAQLRQFRGHSRADKAAVQYMWGLTRSLTDTQIDGLAAYFAGQEPRSPGSGNPLQATLGEALFRQGIPAQNVPACAACHGEAGQGSAAGPRLASQHADYTAKQTMIYQQTTDRPDGGVMKAVVHGLAAEDVADIAQYLQGVAAGRFMEDGAAKTYAGTPQGTDGAEDALAEKQVDPAAAGRPID